MLSLEQDSHIGSISKRWDFFNNTLRLFVRPWGYGLQRTFHPTIITTWAILQQLELARLICWESLPSPSSSERSVVMVFWWLFAPMINNIDLWTYAPEKMCWSYSPDYYPECDSSYFSILREVSRLSYSIHVREVILPRNPSGKSRLSHVLKVIFANISPLGSIVYHQRAWFRGLVLLPSVAQHTWATDPACVPHQNIHYASWERCNLLMIHNSQVGCNEDARLRARHPLVLESFHS